MHTLATALIDLGVIGVLSFVSLAFCVRQLPRIDSARLAHTLSGPLARHAPSSAVLSAVVLAAGVTVGA